MSQQYLPDDRTGGGVQRRLYETDQILEAGSGNEIGEAVAFVIANRARLEARNAMKEAASRLYAANNFR